MASSYVAKTLGLHLAIRSIYRALRGVTGDVRLNETN